MNIKNEQKTATKSFPLVGTMILMLFAGKIFEITPTLAAMSWWWVFSPLLIVLGIVGVVFLVALLIAVFTK